ncbi:MAG: hypothetical protein NWQ54_06610 [Paraglaciecola sp.]|uniref:hypothetical protein n=1 Tax=Paraglaciecola sp. TaxID=1920173 RepID=UPI00273EE46D|nr:hypothetical protein [Paraglaciecola sp.]MDP5033210.1 hypothetical protein [Paraglaciecola sp.]MDP5130537.1 hypothetical protein [Paraglaciecola sp.]
MQLNSQLKQVDLRRIQIADEAKEAFALSSSFNYQMDSSLLNSRVHANQPWDFEIPFAYMSEGLIRVFAGWVSLQRPFQSLLPRSKLICTRVFEDRPRSLETIAWQYVMHTLSRCQHRNFALAYVAKMVELCPNSTLQKLTKSSSSASIESAVMTLCSETRQPVRTQIKRLAKSKQVQGWRVGNV